jgi:hypothetical protein
MDPQVTAAVIAGVLTLTGTLAAQIIGRRQTRRDLRRLDFTLAEQRARDLNERFATAAGQLGSDKPSTVRLAGVYTMAGLADDWEDKPADLRRHSLRLSAHAVWARPRRAPEKERLAFEADREVRHTVIRVITAHLKADAARCLVRPGCCPASAHVLPAACAS